MNVEYLIQLLENRLKSLDMAKEQAFLTGDLETINSLDAERNGVTDTLSKLKLLQGISETAASTPFTEAEVVKNGIEASMGSVVYNTVSGSGSIDCLKAYDITSYATDPLHEQKIQDILSNMGEMSSAEVIDAYISGKATASPVTGAMIVAAAEENSIDIRLAMALMELDSRFGTAGVAVDTLNPGNVGNTGTATRTYDSWQDGVNAVASWLNRHRLEVPIEEATTSSSSSETVN